MNLRSKLPPKLRQFATVGALIKLPLLLPAMLVVGIFILLRPFVIIQVYKVHDWRIGHMVSTTQRLTLEVREWNLTHKKKKIVLYYFGSKSSSNNFFKKMLMRHHLSLQNNWGFLLYYLCSQVSFLTAITIQQTIDNSGLLLKYGTELQFSANEISEGSKFLSKFGLVPFGKFVCLNVRDDRFLEKSRRNKVFKHTPRNSNIETYLTAAEYLAERDYTIFRMGSSVNGQMSSPHKRIIDYATNGMRTEFLDIFLGAHCKFSISTGSGWDEIPKIFRRPVMFTNIVPILEINEITRPVLIFPKQLLDQNSNQLISINCALERSLANQSNANYLQENSVGLVDLSADDLMAAASEMVARVEGTFVETPEQKQMQAKLKHILNTHPKIQPTPGYYSIRAEFASCFLSRYPHFLE